MMLSATSLSEWECVDAAPSPDATAALLRDVFGRTDVVVRPLPGERDHNFAVLAGSERLLLKISASSEPAGMAGFQAALLESLARIDPGLPTPHLKPTLDGRLEHAWAGPDGRTRTVRLMTWRPGRPLRTAGSEVRPEALGRAFGALDLALAAVPQPAVAAPEVLWNLQRWAEVLPLASAAPADLRHPVESALRAVGERCGAMAARLPWQLIHNDLNLDNVIVDGEPARVSGLIDFGDAVHAPRVQDLAVAAAYHLREDDPDLFAAVRPLVRGYDEVLRLEAAEIEALPELIAGRLAITVAIASWRAARHPQNRDYILRNWGRAVAGLRRLYTDEGRRAADALRAALARAPA